MMEAITKLVVGAQLSLANLKDREEGQALVEYALILFLIAVVCIGTLALLGNKVNSVLNAIQSAI